MATRMLPHLLVLGVLLIAATLACVTVEQGEPPPLATPPPLAPADSVEATRTAVREAMATRMAAQETTQRAQATASTKRIMEGLEARAVSRDDEWGTGIRATATAQAEAHATRWAGLQQQGLPPEVALGAQLPPAATAVAGMVTLPFVGTAERIPEAECLRLYEAGTPVILVLDCLRGTLDGVAFLLGLKHTGHVVLAYGGVVTYRGQGGGFESKQEVIAFTEEYVCLLPPRFAWGALNLRTGTATFIETQVRAVCGEQAYGVINKSFWPPYVLGLGHDRYPRLLR